MMFLPSPCAPPRSRGFTLIELLVTVAIIAVLAALSLGALGSIRTSSQRSVCASNMSRLWQACLSFSADNAGWLPGARLAIGPQKINNQPTDEQIGWLAKTLEGYIEDRVIYDPDPVNVAYSQTPNTQGASPIFGRVWKLYNSSFNPDGVNAPLVLGTTWPYSIRLSAISQPQKTALFNCQDDPRRTPWLYPHKGKINRIFADGHVEIIKAN